MIVARVLSVFLVAATVSVVSTTPDVTYKDFGPCYYFIGPTTNRNKCVHIVKKEHNRAEAGAMCAKFNSYLPTEVDTRYIYKLLWWYYDKAPTKIFFFANTDEHQAEHRDPNGIGYDMAHIDDINIIKDQNKRHNIVICIRERMPKLRCPPEFTLYENYRACFLHDESQTRTFWECKMFCHQKGGYPVVFDSVDQYKFIKKELLGNRNVGGDLKDGFWSGHFIPNKFNGARTLESMRANMYTVDGSLTMKEGRDELWRRGEPNAGGRTGDDEHCIEFWPNELFNDYFCKKPIKGCTCRAIVDQTGAAFD
uniref:C-type lectin domain-containing protein n=1 Tax=Panagrellus redivivus TaxID=6233 RepID=A0A7E4ZWD5_PANRE